MREGEREGKRGSGTTTEQNTNIETNINKRLDISLCLVYNGSVINNGKDNMDFIQLIIWAMILIIVFTIASAILTGVFMLIALIITGIGEGYKKLRGER